MENTNLEIQKRGGRNHRAFASIAVVLADSDYLALGCRRNVEARSANDWTYPAAWKWRCTNSLDAARVCKEATFYVARNPVALVLQLKNTGGVGLAGVNF